MCERNRFIYNDFIILFVEIKKIYKNKKNWGNVCDLFMEIFNLFDLWYW